MPERPRFRIVGASQGLPSTEIKALARDRDGYLWIATADGVGEGRRTYANIMKYVRMGTSSNFGNMVSMAVASLFIPFLPLTPI